MSLVLIELSSKNAIASQQQDVEKLLSDNQGQLVEAFKAPGLEEHYIVVDNLPLSAVEKLVQGSSLDVLNVKEVRLVGEPASSNPTAQYLVEWDIPEGVTMDKYLARKAEKTPLYANVPETQFKRTYVCEDMSKCLCLYDAPDEDAVRRAREAVDTPIDRLTRIES